MTQLVRILDAKPDDLRAIPRTYLVEEQNLFKHVAGCPLISTSIPWDVGLCINTHPPTPIHTPLQTYTK